jgi:hypothetical protein
LFALVDGCIQSSFFFMLLLENDSYWLLMFYG